MKDLSQLIELELIALIMLIAIAVGIKAALTPPRYRIKMTDPYTQQSRYLLSIDGINGQFKYTSDAKSAMVIVNGAKAEKLMSALPDDANPVIEVRNRIIGWKTMTRQG